MSGLLLLVFGGRGYGDRDAVFAALDAVLRKHGVWCLVAGGAEGADRLGERWADERGIPKLIVRARWELEGRAAGPLRNRRMAAVGPDAAVGFPGGRGSRDMAKVLRDLKVPIWFPSGERPTTRLQ